MSTCGSVARGQQDSSSATVDMWSTWHLRNVRGGACRYRHLAPANAGAGGPRTRRREPLLSQQLRKRAVRWGSPGGGAWCATTEGPCESTPAGSAAGRRGEAASLGAVDSASTGAELEEALHTFTLDSGASRCFFRDSTTVTPLTVPVPVTLADPSGGTVVARGATVLPCSAAPSGLLTGIHLPSFAKNLVATSVLQDQWITVTQPEGELVAICMDSRTGEHLATFTRRPGSGLYTLTTESALVAESGQVAASVEAASSCSCRLLTHQTLLWHHRLGHPSLPRLCGMHSRLLVSGLPKSLPPLPRSLAPPCLPCVEAWQRAAPHSSSFPPTTSPLQTLHMDNGIAEHRIGLVMEVARTSMIHAATHHFLWPFAVRYATEELNLWPRVSHPETSPTLRWTGEVGDASAFQVWGSLSLVRDLPAGKLSPRTL
ncbi:unnamed protein product, partial [Closterium sp. NIES-54]